MRLTAVRPAAQPSAVPAFAVSGWNRKRCRQRERRLPVAIERESATPADCALRPPTMAVRRSGLRAAELAPGGWQPLELKGRPLSESRPEEKSAAAADLPLESRAARFADRPAAARAEDDCLPPARREAER